MLAGVTGSEPRRVFEPRDVAARLGMSVAGLRRLAHAYERVHGELPRDERGRLWPEEAVEELERARNVVRSGRSVSVEAALQGAILPEGSEGQATPTRPGAGDLVALAELLEELRGLREAVEQQNELLREQGERLAAIERENRELRAALPTPAEPVTEDRESEEQESSPEPVAQGPKPGLFGRVRAWVRGW